MPNLASTLSRLGRGRAPAGLVLAAFLVLQLAATGLFERPRLELFDLYQRAWPRQRQSAPVTIVAIDDASLTTLGQWPWPRQRLAALVARILAGQPAALGIDIIMPEPDRLSPEQWQKDEALPPFRLLVIGDFGGTGEALSLRGDIPTNLPEQFGTALDIEVANLLGSAPARLAFNVPVRRLADFSARALLATIEPLRRAAALRARVAAGSTEPEGFDDLDSLLAAIGATQPVRRLPVKEAVAAIDRIIAAQLAAIHTEPRFAAVEAAWRGLQLLLRRPYYGEDVQIDLIDAPEGAAASCLLRDVVPDELEQQERPGLGAVLVLGSAPSLVEGLIYGAVAGAALQVPVIASLPQGCFETETAEDVAAWDLLRGQDGAEWLAACHGDLVLDAEEREPPLWGEPGWAVAALALASVARTSWPCELADPSVATVEGLELHEIVGRGGAAAWPLREPATSSLVAALKHRGVASLGALANRDRVFLAAAPTVGDETGLADRLLIASLRAQLRGLSSAEAIAAVLGALLPNAAELTIDEQPEGGFAIALKPGLRSLGGRRIAFDQP